MFLGCGRARDSHDARCGVAQPAFTGDRRLEVRSCATPKTLAKVYTIEFALLGTIAGVIGSAAACGFASLLLGLIFYRWEVAIGWQVVAGAVFCSALLTTLAGWVPTYPLLRQKPMNVLRGI